MNGYAEKILHVDLVTRKTIEEPFPERWRQAYTGGRGLCVRILQDLVEPGIEPLSPENVLVIAPGHLPGAAFRWGRATVS